MTTTQCPMRSVRTQGFSFEAEVVSHGAYSFERVCRLLVVALDDGSQFHCQVQSDCEGNAELPCPGTRVQITRIHHHIAGSTIALDSVSLV